jgi:O-antigen/teichoic acid export membrane protein
MPDSSNAWLRDQFDRFFSNELIRRVVKNSGYLFSATGISAALSFIQNILVARLLGPAGLGVLAAITQFTTVVNNVASFRMGELVIKYIGEFTENQQPEMAAAVFKAAAVVEMLASLVAFALAWLLAPLGARYLAKDAGLAPWFILYGLIILANLISESSTGLLQIFDRYRPMASLNVIGSIFTLVLIVLAYITQGGMLEVLLAYIVGKVIGAVGLTLLAIQEANRRWGRQWWRTPLGILRPQARQLVKFAVSTNLSGSLSLINKSSDILWISFFRTPTETGFFKQAQGLVNLVQLPVSPLPQATYPELSREVARNNWKNVRYVLRQGSLLAGGFTLAATLVLVIFGRQIITLLYRPEYLPAYPALLIMLVGFLVANTFYWNRTILLALNHPDFPTKVNLVVAILKTAGILLLVPAFGYLAGAALLSASYLLGVSLSVWKARQVINAQGRVRA